jgi:hypothetical protein
MPDDDLKYRSKIGPLPEDALSDEVLYDPEPKTTPEMREWLDDLAKEKTK